MNNCEHDIEVYENLVSFKEVKVACLQDVDTLKEICEKQGLKFNDCDTPYEVEMILEYKLVDGKRWYFVKWKNYSSTYNTWEPSSHLTGCRDMIKYYHAMQKPTLNIDRNLLNYFVRDLISRKPYDILTMTKVFALFFNTSEKYVNSLKLSTSQMKLKIKQILDFSDKKVDELGSRLSRIMRYGLARRDALINLKEWEDEINSGVSCRVQVENQVDLERAPNNFKFIYDYVNTIVRPRLGEPIIFCRCNDCFKERDDCCPNDSDGIFAYNKFKRLILEPGYPIFECNDKCFCPADCANRVVQHGQKIKVQIFRTSNGTGWGLKTLETIEKGQFVLEYLGEIITSELAEARGRIYDYVGRSYLFDLDYGVDNASCCYTVDATHFGNASRFINHSCEPNLHVFAVWINEEDPNLPRLAFFSKRKICKGEELTFDYKMQKEYTGNEPSRWEKERVLCRCQSRKCRKYLF